MASQQRSSREVLEGSGAELTAGTAQRRPQRRGQPPRERFKQGGEAYSARKARISVSKRG